MRREITRRGGKKPCGRIVCGMFTALADPAGVIAHRAGVLEQVQLLLEDWQLTGDRLAEHRTADDRRPGRARADRPGHLDDRPVRCRRCGDPGRDRRPARFATGRAVVKHAGLAPRENLSGAFNGRTKLTGQGRPRAAAGGLARGLGSPARQPGLGRPLPVPAPCRHHRIGLGPGDCHPWHRAEDSGTPGRRAGDAVPQGWRWTALCGLSAMWGCCGFGRV